MSSRGMHLWRSARKPAIRVGVLAFGLIVLLLLGACGRPPVTDRPLDPVRVQLKWIHQAQFAGMYVADHEAFYADEGLAVELVPGGVDVPPAEITAHLIAGETDFAIVGGDQLLQARARGEPVVAVAVIFQRNPYVYVSLSESNIRRPQDLMGKRVVVPDDAVLLHQALLDRQDLNPDALTYVPYVPEVDQLIDGEVDVMLVYRTGLGLAFDETGADLSWMWLEDYGVHVYADTLITTEALIADNPDLVTRFLSATLRGWRHAIENPDLAVDLTLAYDPALDRARQARMMTAQLPLIHTGELPVGGMTREAWESAQAIVLGQDKVDIDGVYTLRFLDDVYDAYDVVD